MATTDGTLALGSGTETPARPMGVFARPGNTPGWRGWITTVDHKRIAIMYGAAALFFFLIGGTEALLIRLQLAAPEGEPGGRRRRPLPRASCSAPTCTTRCTRCTAPP